MKFGKLFHDRKENAMKPEEGKKVPEEKLEQVTGGGDFDDVQTVDEHNYDPDTRTVAVVNPR